MEQDQHNQGHPAGRRIRRRQVASVVRNGRGQGERARPPIFRHQKQRPARKPADNAQFASAGIDPDEETEPAGIEPHLGFSSIFIPILGIRRFRRLQHPRLEHQLFRSGRGSRPVSSAPIPHPQTHPSTPEEQFFCAGNSAAERRHHELRSIASGRRQTAGGQSDSIGKFVVIRSPASDERRPSCRHQADQEASNKCPLKIMFIL